MMRMILPDHPHVGYPDGPHGPHYPHADADGPHYHAECTHVGYTHTDGPHL